jgi:hypothetical protein
MNSISKTAPILLVLILASASSFIILHSASAQSTLNPSVPEFTVKYVDLSYNTQAVYGIDQYTGKTVVKEESYHVDNRSLQFTIKNQPFTTYTDPSGNQTGLYYNFRIKGAYGTEWEYYPFAPNGWTTRRYGGILGGTNPESPADLAQSSAGDTIITFQIPGVYRVPQTGAQIEVQAQALIGYMVPSDYMMAGHVYIFTGQYGDWSSSQTVTVGESLASPTLQNPTIPPNPTTHQTTTPTTTPASTAISGDSTNNTISLPTTTFALIIAAFTILIVALLLLLFIRHRKAAKVSVI